MGIFALILCLIAIVGIMITTVFIPSINIKNLKINLYWVIALFIAITLLIFNFIPFNEVLDGLFSNNGMNPIKILILFLSMTCISVYLDELGLFSYVANIIVKRNNSSQIKIYISLCILVSFLTMFTSNDIVILTLTPFIIFFCKRSNISPIPYLVSEFIIANTWSLMFIIGNPTNIYIASSYNIDFIEYFNVMFVPTICAGIVEFFILYLLFRNKLKEKIKPILEDQHHLEKFLVIYGLIILILCTILLILSSYIDNIEMYFISFISFILLVVGVLIYSLIKKRKPIELLHTFKRAPYELIPFLLSMFIISLTLKHYGYTDLIHNLFGEKYTNIIYGYSSLISSNLFNNIPMSVIYTNVISGLEGLNLKYAIYGTIIGSNIGAFLTPLGALAGIMWMSILHKYNIKFNTIDFIKYGIITAIPTATVAILMITLFIF